MLTAKMFPVLVVSFIDKACLMFDHKSPYRESFVSAVWHLCQLLKLHKAAGWRNHSSQELVVLRSVR